MDSLYIHTQGDKIVTYFYLYLNRISSIIFRSELYETLTAHYSTETN